MTAGSLHEKSCLSLPRFAFSVVNKKAIGAINITASHNPPGDNGFKVRDHNGGAIDPAGLNEIEELIPPSEELVKRLAIKDAVSQGKVVYFDPAPDYIAHIKELVDVDAIKDADIKVLVDPMWGNGAGWFSRILDGGRITIEEIHSDRNPIFPQMHRPEPIPPNVNVGLAETVKRKADVLIITDGDADRVGVGDETGTFIDQLRMYALLAYYLLVVRGELGPIVKTLSTTGMLNKLGKIYGVPVYETGVGFKYVAPKFLMTRLKRCGISGITCKPGPSTGWR